MQFTAPPYDHDHENEVMLFAETNFRNARRKFGIKTDDRRRHVYVVGKTGMGKSTLLENMFLHDIESGHGAAYIDPHGETAQRFLDFVPPQRINDVVYFNPADIDFPIGFNVMETNGTAQEKNLVGQGLMGVFKKIWGPEVFSARMEYIMLNTVLALLDTPGSTLLGINRMYVDEDYRKRVVSLIQDPSVKAFWVKEFASWEPKYRTEAVAAIQNKVGQFLSSAIIRNIVAQVKSTMNIREIMDTRKILVCNIAKGLVGEENARLLGAMLITRLQLAAMERIDIPHEKDRQDFYLYVDEFQNFATESFANILSEARKYRLNLVVAHQYIEQLDETVRAAVFGNVGTIITFRVGAADATFMEQEFAPRFTPEDLVNLRKFEIYLKLMIDGASSQPFSATTLPQIANRTGSAERVLRVSRERYSTPRQKIEEKVLKWSGIEAVPHPDDEGEEAPRQAPAAPPAAPASAPPIAAASAPASTPPLEVPPAPPAPALDDEEAQMEAQIKALEASSPKIPESAPPPGKKKKPAFEIPCSVCGKVQTLNFEPDWSRPWFCKDDLEKRKAAKEAGKEPPPPTAAAPIPVEVPPVSLSALPPQPSGSAPHAAPPRSQPSLAPRPAAPPSPPRIASAPIPLVDSETKPVSLTAMLGKPLPEGPPEEIVDDGRDDQPPAPAHRAPPRPAQHASPSAGHAPRAAHPPAPKPPAPRPHAAAPRPASQPRPPAPRPAPPRPPEPPAPVAGPSSPPQPPAPRPLSPGQVIKF